MVARPAVASAAPMTTPAAAAALIEREDTDPPEVGGEVFAGPSHGTGTPKTVPDPQRAPDGTHPSSAFQNVFQNVIRK